MSETSPWVRVLAVALASSALSGCFLWTSRGEGDDLSAQTQGHEERLDSLESGLTHERERLRGEIERAETQVTKLQSIIEAASRTGADIGASVAELQQRIERLEGQLAESREYAETAQRQVETMRQEVATARQEIEQRLRELASPTGVRLDPNQVPQGRAEHFAAAEREFARDAYGLARSLLREYLTRYSDDDKADDAQHRLGLSYMREGNYASALGEFRKVLTNYPRGDALDDTLLDMAEAFFQLNACTDAKGALNALLRAHSRSPLVARARAKLAEIERAPAGRCAS